MTTLELQAKKAALAKSILRSNDEKQINRLSNLYNDSTDENFPCDYTREEILSSCKEAIEEYKAGGGIPHSEMKRKVL